MDELLTRQMPHSLEAEQAVIGSMLIDPSCVADMLELVKPDDFYLQQNKDIFTTIYTMFNYSMDIDPVTVMDQMKQSGVYDEEKTRDYLLQILDITPTAANAKQYAQIVADKSLLRQIAQAAKDISEIVTFLRGRTAEHDDILCQMARATISMVTESVDAYVKHDTIKAEAVLAADDTVDAYFCQVKQALISRIAADPGDGEYALDLLMIAKYFERIGDHATNIAEWVIFSITGRHKEG